jgi:hypothetical protein
MADSYTIPVTPRPWASPFGVGLFVLILCVFAGDISTNVKAKLDSEIHTVLPFDGIPAVFEPTFVTADRAEVEATSPMIGVSINGEQHAYSSIMLNHHEIVNDVVGEVPIATTW